MLAQEQLIFPLYPLNFQLAILISNFSPIVVSDCYPSSVIHV